MVMMLNIKKKFWISSTVLLCLVFLIVSVFSPFAAENNNKNNSGAEINPPDMTPYKIQVVDSKTGRGVPMILIENTNGARYYTDSAGYVSFYDPALMDQDVFFLISGPGYVYPRNSMGSVGERVTVRPGESVKFEVDRVSIAERLYRVTGQGIYRDSVALGQPVPIEKPILNTKVMKQDSAKVIEYKGKLYWFWGDTYSSSKAEGNLRVTGAVSELPGKGGLDPDLGVNLKYFAGSDGYVKEMAPNLQDGSVHVELSSLMKTTKDGKECLLAGYVSYDKDNKEVSRGILMFNDQKEQFDLVVRFEEDEMMRYPQGNAFLCNENGKEYWVFCNPLPTIRVVNDYNSIINPDSYEVYTPIKQGAVYDKKVPRKTELDLDDNGNLKWSWKKKTGLLTQEQEENLIRIRVIKHSDAFYRFTDVDNGNAVELYSAAIQWNEYRKSWIMIAQSKKGTEPLGDIYYAEAKNPSGPWKNGKLIVSHDQWAFYNPIFHPYFSKDNGRIIYFEGNFDNDGRTSKPVSYYDNNQLMYKLDLSDPRLNLSN